MLAGREGEVVARTRARERTAKLLLRGRRATRGVPDVEADEVCGKPEEGCPDQKRVEPRRLVGMEDAKRPVLGDGDKSQKRPIRQPVEPTTVVHEQPRLHDNGENQHRDDLRRS